MKFFDFGYSCYFDSLYVFGSFCQQLIHKLTGVAIALKTTSVWQNHPGFDHNIEGWTVFGKGAIKERISNASSRFIVAHNRTHPLDSFSQKVQLKKGMLYTFSTWLQVSEGSDIVSVMFKTKGSKMVRGGQVIAKHGRTGHFLSHSTSFFFKFAIYQRY
ncbi:hypothetical protein AAZX31_04G155600 [Glycine max]|nr:hypothetical protein GLYMA_04G170850v4 [Glycine max]KAH1111786.1 hypothetical protein GYH30_010223 [Glycine max]